MIQYRNSAGLWEFFSVAHHRKNPRPQVLNALGYSLSVAHKMQGKDYVSRRILPTNGGRLMKEIALK
jgi:hypothetical protein